MAPLKESVRRLARPFAVHAARSGLRSLSLSAGAKRRLWRAVNTYFAYEGVAGWSRTVWGDEIYCDAADFIQKHIFFFGEWEPAFTRYMRSLKPVDGVFVDIGANIGYFSLLGSTIFERVKAFEASAATHAKLRTNIERNARANIDAVNVAIGARHGEATLYAGPPGNIGKASLINSRAVKPGEETARETVQMAPLSAHLEPSELAKVRLVKIDVEGAEPAVVAGLLGSIPAMRRDLELIIEVTPDDAGEVRRMYDSICAAGFRPFVLAGAYDLNDYLAAADPADPVPAQGFPDTQTDILFRRV